MVVTAQIRQSSPFILRACFALVFVGILCWHVSILNTTSRIPAGSDTEAPRTFYSGSSKRVIYFDWASVHGLAHQRITQLERDFWEATNVADGSVAAGCSTLYPSHSPASSCWQDRGLQQKSTQAGGVRKPVQVKVSLLEVPQGETVESAMAKRMQEAVDQAAIDAHTEAISKGLSGTQAQHYAEAHRQQLLRSDTQQLAMQHSPTFDLESMDLQSFFSEVLGDAGSTEQLAVLSGMMRTVIEQLEATLAAHGDDGDEYEEPSLEESAADARTIHHSYRKIVQTLPVNLHGQPACAVDPRLGPIPLHISNTPWLPVLKQLFSEFGRVDSDGRDVASTTWGSARRDGTGDASEGALERQGDDEMQPSASTSAHETPAAVDHEQDIRDTWGAANAAQRQLEEALRTERLPPPSDAQNYAKLRLQQVSDMSRRMDNEYYTLFLQRARAKQLLHERERNASDAHFHTADFADQLNRIHSITRFAMGPVSDEYQAIDALWRKLVHMTTLQTRARACVAAGGSEDQCHSHATSGSRPPVYSPFEALTASQQQEFRGLLEGLFNASVPQPPVRLPVLHWDERVQSTMRGQKVNLQARASADEEAVNLWIEGTGEPRQDVWQVAQAIAGSHTDERDDLVKALQARLVQRYLHFQVHQLLKHIEEWSELMDPEKIRETILEWKRIHPQDAENSAPASTSEELLAQLRAKLRRSEQGGPDEE